MADVVVNPSAVQLSVAEDETILEAAFRLGYSWPTICGGEGSCRTCFFEARSGAEHLSEMSAFERDALLEGFGSLERNGFPLRLACQAKAVGDAVLFKRGVRPTQPSS